ncbi:alpha/beta fold hydrolase [Aspergillus lucknowensis]|uniref:Alpha/beta hydrolase n=1 Tax=Aspergillus lucknowensis TaxID=176173 RepID=A0ABR4LFI2_9EURO
MSSLFLSISQDTTLHLHITEPRKDSSKPLLIFLHYWGGSSLTWYKLTSVGSSSSLTSDYPTASMDLRGWGKSTGPGQDNGRAYSITTMAGDIASAIVQLYQDADTKTLLDHGFILVGHSMGAKVALAALYTLPAHLLQELKGILLVAPAPPAALVLPPEMKKQQKTAYDSEASVRWILANVLAEGRNLTETDTQNVVRDSLSGNALAKAAWPTYGMAEDVSEDVKHVFQSSPARGVSIHVRVLAGELDIVEPRERVEKEVCQFLRDAGARVSFRIVPGVKHLIPLESPGDVYEEITIF